MVVEGVCPLVVLIGHLGRHGAELVGMLNEVPAAAEHEFGPPAVQCESQAPPDLLEEDGLGRSVGEFLDLSASRSTLRALAGSVSFWIKVLNST